MDNKRFQKYYQSNEHFRIENPNPEWQKKRGFIWDRGDCTIRALANSAGISWIDAFDYLAKNARQEFNVMSDGCGFRKWLVKGGGVWTACKAEKGKKRMTVLDFAKSHPKGRYCISVASHETAVVGYIDMANFRI